MKFLLVFTLTTVALATAEEFSLYLNLGDTITLSSLNYPNPAPDGNTQTWFISTSYDGRIFLDCEPDFRVPDGKECGDYRLEVEDIFSKEQVCGVRHGYQRMCAGSYVSVTLRTGTGLKSYMQCTATAAPADGIITTEKPVDPWGFLNEKSIEIDSSEDGITAGVKALSCDCGWRNQVKSRISGGRDASDIPFVVSIVQEASKRKMCNAVVLTRNHILSTAFCTDPNRGSIYISGGDPTKKLGEVLKITEHPHFNRHKMLNDISIITLKNPLEFSDSLGPVCLLNKPESLTGQYIKVIGWGNSGIEKANLRVLAKSNCHYLSPRSVPKGSPTQMCAYGTGKGACAGDSGAPLVWVDPETNRYTLVGLDSYGIDECGSKTPRISTDVLAYIGWIKSTIKESNTSADTCSKLE